MDEENENKIDRINLGSEDSDAPQPEQASVTDTGSEEGSSEPDLSADAEAGDVRSEEGSLEPDLTAEAQTEDVVEEDAPLEEDGDASAGGNLVPVDPPVTVPVSIPVETYTAIDNLRYWMEQADRQLDFVDDLTPRLHLRLRLALGIYREAERGGPAAVAMLISHPFFQGRLRKPSANQLANVAVQLATRPRTKKLRELCSSQAPLVECACDDGVEVEEFVEYAQSVTLKECRKRVAVKHRKVPKVKKEVIVSLSIATNDGTRTVKWTVPIAVAEALAARAAEWEGEEDRTQDLSTDLLDLADAASGVMAQPSAEHPGAVPLISDQTDVG